MAVVMYFRWEGVTAAQYDMVKDSVKFHLDPPPGGLFHVASVDAGGLTVTDIWESEAHFQQFLEKRLAPATQQAGIPGQPQVSFEPVHFSFAPALLLRGG